MHDEDKFYINHIDSVFKKKSFLSAGNVDQLPSCQVRLSGKNEAEV